jgi:intraflagellar transport protein 46
MSDPQGRTMSYTNQHYDAGVNVDSEEDFDSQIENPEFGGTSMAQNMSAQPHMMARPRGPQQFGNMNDDVDVDEDDEGYANAPDPDAFKSAGDGADGGRVTLYNPADWADVNSRAPPDVRELFTLITRHNPAPVILEAKLRPFIPDFAPAVGDIDAFLKVDRPDAAKESLGLVELDEPSLAQSDPTVLDMRLRRDARKAGLDPIAVRSIENADKNPQRVLTWLQNVEAVHRDNPPVGVTYAKPMPTIETLMRVWPAQFEQALKTGGGTAALLPPGDINLGVADFAKVACALLDVPVHEGRSVESLHLLFSLYAEFKSNSQHFSNNDAAGACAGPGAVGAGRP